MEMVLRRLVAAGALGVALLLGSSAAMAHAEPASSASPKAGHSKSATAKAPSSKSASPKPSTKAEAANAGEEVDFGDDADVPPDNSRLLWILGGAALVAVIAGSVVVIKR